MKRPGSRARDWTLSLGVLGLLASTTPAGCDERSAGPAIVPAPAATPSLTAAARRLPSPAGSARRALASAPASALPSPSASAGDAPRSTARLFARASVNVMAEPARDAMQIGMLALGDVAETVGEPLAKPDCAGGWVRLRPLGHVCLGDATTRDEKDVALARSEGRAPPAAAYPFSYGDSLGAVVYARVPTEEEQTRSEPGLEQQRAVLATARRAAMLGKDEEIPAHLRGVELTAPADPCPRELLVHHDEDAPMARLATIPARAGVAWLSDCEAEGRTWLITPEQRLVPRDRVARVMISTARGVERPAGKIAFVTGKARPRYRMVRYGYFEVMEPTWPLYTALQLTGQTHAVGASSYLETSENGAYVLSDHVAVIDPQPRPSDVGPAEKWLDLDTRRSVLLAMEGDKVVYAALIAAPGSDDPQRRGRHRLEWKHLTRTLGDGAGQRAHLPHVMTVAGGLTLLGDPYLPPLGLSAGQSARLTPADAAFVFAWAEPAVPAGWTSRRGTEKDPGTWVFVR